MPALGSDCVAGQEPTNWMEQMLKHSQSSGGRVGGVRSHHFPPWALPAGGCQDNTQIGVLNASESPEKHGEKFRVLN